MVRVLVTKFYNGYFIKLYCRLLLFFQKKPFKFHTFLIQTRWDILYNQMLQNMINQHMPKIANTREASLMLHFEFLPARGEFRCLL